MPRIAILVAGMPGAGKSIVTSIASEMGIPVVTMGDVVREEASRRGLESTLSNLLRIADELRRTYGPHAIAMLTVKRVQTLNACAVIIDGVRSLDEVEYFRERLSGHVVILAIHASPRTRFERLLRRGRPGDPKNWDEFRRRDMKELSWGLGNVIALADIMLVNEGRLNEFISSVRNLLREVLGEWCT